jgi:hypothetical protein
VAVFTSRKRFPFIYLLDRICVGLQASQVIAKKNFWNPCQKSGFHGDEDVSIDLLATYVMWTCRKFTCQSTWHYYLEDQHQDLCYKLKLCHPVTSKEGFEFLTAVSTKLAVFWVVARCRLV